MSRVRRGEEEAGGILQESKGDKPWQSTHRSSQRIATFLHIWYGEQGTTVSVAEALGVSRSHISHSVQTQAIALVACRFLELAWRIDVPA
jgi:hypothetical protein